VFGNSNLIKSFILGVIHLEVNEITNCPYLAFVVEENDCIKLE
jgi:hypothetical protein